MPGSSATLQERRLLEALQVLVGERGAGGRRALRVEEFDKLFVPANTTTMRRIAEITKLAEAQGIAIDQIVVNLANVGAEINQVTADVQAFTGTIQADFDALTVDVDAANAAAQQAQAIKDDVEILRDAATGAANTATTQSGIATDAATDAANSATSAASSAAVAFSSSTDAGTAAGAAQTAQTAAETARAGAESAETAAASSATGAGSSAAAASSSATNAATSASEAGTSATAAAGSASTAQTAATDAETSATAAASSATTAATGAADAGVARDQAVAARDSADSAAALAGDRLAVTASITSQGVSVLRDQFLETLSAEYWTRVSEQGSLTRPDNTLFTIGRDWVFTVAAGQADGLTTRSDRDIWRGARNSDRYVVEVDFTLTSGGMDAASIWFDWVNAASTVYRVTGDLADGVVGPIVAGLPMTASFLVERPDAFSGTFAFNQITAWASRAGTFADPAKTIRFHRISIRPANEAESRVVDVEASVTAESIARAAADAALATQITSVETDLDGVSATVTSQATAISTLEGNATATLAFRVKAGSSGAQLELVAADDPSGSVSVARIAATDIILDGTVTAGMMNVTELSAISANIGTFQSASSGERIVIEDDKISVFDSGNQLRVRIGNLS